MPAQSSELTDIQNELTRLDAKDARVSLDPDFEPEAGTLAKLEIGEAYWHLLPQELLRIAQQVPDGAGSEKLKQAIEEDAAHVWHGPSPEGSRDTSH